MNASTSKHSVIEIGEKLFQWRDYTPIPLLMLLLFAANPNPASATIGTLLVVMGELFRIYGVAFIGTISRTRTTSLGAELCRSGPFAYVRNPLYIGNFIITSGIAIHAGSPWLVVLVMGLTAFQYFCIVKYEETLLLERFGETYRQYCDEVPAWLPSRLPKLTELEWPTTFSDALRSEKRTLTAIALVLLALILIGKH